MITNTTRNSVIVKNTRVAGSLWERARGLMFTQRFKDTALIFSFPQERVIGLHMWFVFYPIDVLWLDGEQRVVEVLQGFRPFRIYRPNAPAAYVIELPEGAIAKSKTIVGDSISFIPGESKSPALPGKQAFRRGQ